MTLHHANTVERVRHRSLSWQAAVAAVCLLGATVGGCVSVGTGSGCITGDCQDGFGTLHQPDGKYTRVSEGTFRGGKLWTGKVSLALENMDAILFQEVKDGKVVWERPYGH